MLFLAHFTLIPNDGGPSKDCIRLVEAPNVQRAEAALRQFKNRFNRPSNGFEYDLIIDDISEPLTDKLSNDSD